MMGISENLNLQQMCKDKVYLLQMMQGICVIGYFTPTGLKTKQVDVFGLRQLILSDGLIIENITNIKPYGTVEFRGLLTEADFQPNRPNRICLAEINGDNGTTYILVNRQLQCGIVTKAKFVDLVNRKLIDNYTSDSSGIIRRMPKQSVTEFSSKLQLDTYWGMEEADLTKVLQTNGFKVGYKYSYTIYDNLFKRDLAYTDLCWYDKNGAIVWYSQLDDRGGKSDPFYCGCHLMVFGATKPNTSALDLINCGVSIVNGDKAQRLEMDAREGLISNYTNLLKVFNTIRPWIFGKTSDTKSSNRISRLTSKKDQDELSRIAFKIGNIPEEEQSSSIYLYGLRNLIGTKRLVERFSGELKCILSGFLDYYPTALIDEIGSQVVYNSTKVEDIVKFLEAAGEKTTIPVADIAKKAIDEHNEAMNKQRIERENHVKQSDSSTEKRKKTLGKSGRTGFWGLINSFDKSDNK